jgi:hypothetical protein
MYSQPNMKQANPFDNCVQKLVYITLIIRLINQQQVARMYDVFGRWMLSSKCYLAAFIAITEFLMWPHIILEFNRYML